MIGMSDPLWFCQISYVNNKTFTDINEVKMFLKDIVPNFNILNFISDKSLNDFYEAKEIPMGKTKKCSQFFHGNFSYLYLITSK